MSSKEPPKHKQKATLMEHQWIFFLNKCSAQQKVEFYRISSPTSNEEKKNDPQATEYDVYVTKNRKDL